MAALGVFAKPTEAQNPPLSPHVPGQLLVGFARGTGAAEKVAAHRRRGATLLKSFREIDVDLVRLPSGSSVVEALHSYDAARSVRFAEPNYLRRAYGVTPDDEFFSFQWGLRNSGQAVAGDSGTPDADIDASESGLTQDAWQVTTGSSNVIVAIVDTGLDINHSDLAANIWTNPNEIPGNNTDDDANGFVDDVNGWDFANDDDSVYDPGEVCGGERNDDHGTHVAGIAGAVGNNSVGVAGVNWDVQIMPLKFLTRVQEDCGVGSDADAIDAILYATKMGAQFINTSWGGPPGELGIPQALRQAFIAAGRKGILFASAAGNSGTNLAVAPEYPPSLDLENQIIVAASDNDDMKPGFSNFGGPTDLAAPGVNIASTITEDAYAFSSGTSMAAPFVTGGLALLRSQYPHAPPLELKDRILSSVDQKLTWSFPTTQSGGRLNVNEALREVRPVIPTLLAPNGGEAIPPNFSTTITWRSNIPVGNPTSTYRLEYTTDALASKSTFTNFESGIPAGFGEPADSDAPWTTASTEPRPGGSGGSAARSASIDNDEASWLETTVRTSVSGTVSFWWRVSSENCESPEQPVCGDYFRFYIDGFPVVQENGIVGWTNSSLSLSPGVHTLSWAYQKDQLCPPEPECDGVPFGEDAAWIDDVEITGIENVSWSPLATTPAGSTSFTWAVPSILSPAAKVRICQDTGSPCSAASTDESDSAFQIGLVEITETDGSTEVGEGAGTDSYNVVLLAAPASNVVVVPTPDSQVAVGPSSLTFTTTNWDQPKTVTVSAVDDAEVEPSPSVSRITHSASSSDAAFNNTLIPDVTVSVTDNDVPPPPPPPPVPPPVGGVGYWFVARDGGIFSFGGAGFFGSTGGLQLAAPIVGMASTPTGNGYWFVAADGGIFSFGDAGFHGSTGGLKLNSPIVGMASTPTGKGYWFVAADGGIFSFGDAQFFGSTGGLKLAAPIVGMAATPTGKGYWFVAADGGIFAFGDAAFHGSTGGLKLNSPIVGMAATPTGKGYWFVAADGGIFSFGDAEFFGSTGGLKLAAPIVGMASTPTGKGYWFVAADGGVFAFGDAAFHGSTGGLKLAAPIVGMASR